MAILLKTASVRVSSIQIMQVRVQNKGKSVWKSRYDGDVSVSYKVGYKSIFFNSLYLFLRSIYCICQGVTSSNEMVLR
jgi:hypothetical protein